MRGSPSPAFATSSRLTSSERFCHAARTRVAPSGLETTHPRIQDAFHRDGSRSCDRVKLSAFPFTFLPNASHPCRPATPLDPRHRGSSFLARLFRPCLGLPLGSPWRYGQDAPTRLLPTDSSHDDPRFVRPSVARLAPRLSRGSFLTEPATRVNGPIRRVLPWRRRTALRRSGPRLGHV